MTVQTVRFKERQRLTLADLRDEQDHRRLRQNLHLLRQHGWGVVKGLSVCPQAETVDADEPASSDTDSDDDQANNPPVVGWAVEAGVAIDGYGRYVHLPTECRIERADLTKWINGFQPEDDQDVIWLCLRQVLTPARAECDPDLDDSSRSAFPDRWLEQGVLVLARGQNPEDPWAIPARGGLDILEIPPDSKPRGAWYEEPCGPRPVPLVIVARSVGETWEVIEALPDSEGDETPSTEETVSATDEETPDYDEETPDYDEETPANDEEAPSGNDNPWKHWYPPLTSLVAESLTAASDDARLTLGTDPDVLNRRFSVVIADEEGALTDQRIAIDQHGNVHLGGPVEIGGDALMLLSPRADDTKATGGHVVQFGPVSPPAEGESPVPRPWQVYREARSEDGSQPESLRIELENPGADAELTRYQFNIGGGVRNGDPDTETTKPFEPILSAGMNGAVHIRGVDEKRKLQPVEELLKVEGLIREGPIQASISDHRFARKLLQLSTSGDFNLVFERKDGTQDRPIVSNDTGSDKLSYYLRITNSGLVDVTGIQVYQSVYRNTRISARLPGHQYELQYKVSEGLYLRIGNDQRIHVDVPYKTSAPDGEPMMLAVLVFGVAAVGSLVYGIKSRDIEL